MRKFKTIFNDVCDPFCANSTQLKMKFVYFTKVDIKVINTLKMVKLGFEFRK